ncbi:MAG TPA: hypothetical protein VFJ82_10035, partial [Longimicrobium sp.]|nr:hypothetical protein [Longimicrobium sp.]
MRSLLRWAWLPVLAGAAAFAAHAARRPAPPVARWQALRVPPDSAWTELPVAGRVGQVDVGPDGRLWMGSAQGEIFVADSIGGDWRAALPGPDPNDTSLDFISLPTIDRVTWLGPRTAIASGYIRRGDADATDAVLRTTDGGVRWDTVSFGVDQWVYDAFLDRNGGVWMGGSSGTLVFSGDSGRTWKTVSRPFDASGRLRSIWIEDGRTGVAAALANEFRLTRDGGRTWR